MTTTETPASKTSYALHVYVAVVCLCGATAIGRSIAELPGTPRPAAWMAFSLLAVLAGAFALKVPGVPVRLSVSDTFLMAAAMLFGPAPATVAIAFDSVLITVVYHKTRSPRRILFNLTGPALALWAGTLVFELLTPPGGMLSDAVPVEAALVPLACFAVVYYLLNSGLTAIAIGLEKGLSPLVVWRRHFAVIALNYCGAASTAFFLVVIVRYVGFLPLAAVIPLLVVFQLSMKSWMGRLEDAEQHVATLDRLYLSTITALSTAIEAKDGVTSSHIHRVQHYAMGLAQALGVADPTQLKAIQAAALLHDTGKLAVPERILNKPGKLTPVEFEAMKRHVDVGADILSAIDFPYPVVPIVRAHHENWDGSGYPRGLRGEAIPLGARILSVVDCYDALTSDRPYRPALSDEEAMRIIKGMAGAKYDPTVVSVFERARTDIAPEAASSPHLQQAIQQINRAVEPDGAPERGGIPARTGSPDAMPALVSLARVVRGRPTTADVATLAWSHLRQAVPGASSALFLLEPAEDVIAAAFVAGDAASVLQGLKMRVGERLSGWVADHGQSIVNSDAKLDLGEEAVLAGLRLCLAVPLLHDSRTIGVLSCYAREAFTDEQAATMEMVAPHLAEMVASLRSTEGSPEAVLPASARPSSLRMVARR